MLTYQKHAAPFGDAAGRDAFFAARDGTSAPARTEPGTAVEHVLGTNVGLWGDRGAMLFDAARILLFELRTWAADARVPAIEVPVELVMRTKSFAGLFPKLARVNADELDFLLRSGGEEKQVTPPALPDPTAFLEGLRDELAPMAARYSRLTSHYQDDVSTIYPETDDE